MFLNFMEAIPLCDIIKVYIFTSDTTIIHTSNYYKLIVSGHALLICSTYYCELLLCLM